MQFQGLSASLAAQHGPVDADASIHELDLTLLVPGHVSPYPHHTDVLAAVSAKHVDAFARESVREALGFRRSGSLQSARERIAFHVRQLREVRGISQERLGELTELHQTYVGSIERKERNVSIDNVERIAHALGVDIAELLAR